MKSGIFTILPIILVMKVFSCVPLNGYFEEKLIPINDQTIWRIQLFHSNEDGVPPDTLKNDTLHLQDFMVSLRHVFEDNANVFLGKVENVVTSEERWSETIVCSVLEVYRNSDPGLSGKVCFTVPAHGAGDCFLPNETLAGCEFLGYYDENRNELESVLAPASQYDNRQGYFVVTDENNGSRHVIHHDYPGFSIPLASLPEIYPAAVLHRGGAPFIQSRNGPPGPAKRTDILVYDISGKLVQHFGSVNDYQVWKASAGKTAINFYIPLYR